MGKGWITGAEIMEEYGKAAVEIGQACYKDELIAYCQPAWGQIYDISQTERVPKHPPIGVDALLHKKKGEEVSWDWPVFTGANKMECELNKIKLTLREAISVWKAKHPSKSTATLLSSPPTIFLCPVDIDSIPSYRLTTESTEVKIGGMSIGRPHSDQNFFKDYTFEELDTLIQQAVKLHRDIENKLREIKEIPIAALVESQTILEGSGVSEDILYSRSVAYAWDKLMPLEYSWFIDGGIVETSKLDNSRLFYFDFDMYLRFIQGIYGMVGKQVPSAKDVASSYSQQIGEMWFNEQDVERWVGESPVALAPQQVQSGDETTLDTISTPLNIPPSLWAGKTPDVACQNLKEHGFDNSIIVYIIREKLGKSKAEAGRYAFGEVISKGNEKENSTYARTTDQYIKEVTSRYKLTFNDDANKIQ